MRWLVLVLVLGGPTLSWADYAVTPGKRFTMSELIPEFVQATHQAQMSCANTNGTVACKKVDGSDFTPAEKAAMEAAVTAHDPDIREKRKVAATQKHQGLVTKLCQGAGLTGQDLQDCKEELQ